MRNLMILCGIVSSITLYGNSFEGQEYPTDFYPYNNVLYRYNGYQSCQSVYKCGKDNTAVTLASSLKGWKSDYPLPCKIICADAFANCTKLQSITIPPSYTTFEPPINNSYKPGFKGCAALKTATFTHPSGFSTFPDEVFNGCRSLTTVTLPYKLSAIPARAFLDCERLPSIEIPASVESIGEDAFCGCLSLRDVSFLCAPPEGVLDSHIFDAFPKIKYATAFESDWRAFSIENFALKVSPGTDFEYDIGKEPMVSMGFDVDGIDILYTTDGSDPLQNGVIYTGSFEASGIMQLRAVAAKDDLPWSREVCLMIYPRGKDWSMQIDGSWKSGAIGDNESSCLEVVLTNDCKVSFDWKSSCEPLIKGNPYDFLEFVIDGERQDFICGETDWQAKSYVISGNGEHVLRWIYQKDEEGADGEDCAWVRCIVVVPLVMLSFDGGEAESGTAPADMSFYADDDTAVLPGCGTLALANHSFAGWSDGERVYAAGSACPYLKAAQTLTAVWAANTLSAPVITAPATYEADSATVTITADEGASIYYTLDGSKPTAESMLYLEPFEVEGSAIVRAVAVRDNYFDSEVSQFEVTRLTWTFGEYLNCPGRAFTTGGDAEWVRAKGVSTDGFALRSGAVGNNQTSRLETVVYGAGTIRFSCKVDGEIVKKIVYDGLAFCVDGVQQGDLMGDADWTEKTFTVTGDGRHVLGWLYVKDEEDMNNVGEDCAWLDDVSWMAEDPLPALDVLATDGDANAIIAGQSDVWLSEKVIGTAAYGAFRTWVDGKGLSHTAVRDAPNAWFSYALDAPGLMAKATPLASEDIVIESIEPSGITSGAFDLVVDIAGAEIGTAARLAEVLGVEGATELNESTFSSEGLSFALQRTADGKAKATVSPAGSPPSFFLRVKMK